MNLAMLAHAIIPIATGLCVSPHPCQAYANFAWDMAGTQDSRPDTWGAAQAGTVGVVLTPPPGYRVHVLRLVGGDLVAWPRGTPAPDQPGDPYGHAAGVLAALNTASMGPDPNAPYSYSGCLVYVQDATKGEKITRAIPPTDVSAAGYLDASNTLNFTTAVWLNTLGLVVHLEFTLGYVYQFEAIAQ